MKEKTNEVFPARKPRKLTGPTSRGGTWCSDSITVNGQKQEGYADWTWGKYVYFFYKNRWWKTPVWNMDRDIQVSEEVEKVK